MASEVEETLARLRAHHLDDLPEERRAVLRARLSGVSVADIAAASTRSEAAVRRDIEKVQNAIFIKLVLRPDQWAMAFWAASHLGCCLKAAA